MAEVLDYYIVEITTKNDNLYIFNNNILPLSRLEKYHSKEIIKLFIMNKRII